MLKHYYCIKNDSRIEINIEKSRFIGECFAARSETETISRLDETRKRYPDATHHCYAYCVGLDTVYKRHNDDGEPSGTAGMPILQVISQQEISNVIVIVTRYFGGIKLGAGGLVRAYSKSCAEALNAAGKFEMVLSAVGKITVDYGYFSAIERFARQNAGEVAIRSIDYKQDVSLEVITSKNWKEFEYSIIDLCHGNVLCEKIGDEFYGW